MNISDTVCLAWFGIDAFTHLTIELAYVCLALTSTAQHSNSFIGHIWREYGRADARWSRRDANVISLEVFVIGPLCLLQMFAIKKNKPWRHPLQLLICVAELYGGWMTFAPEWVDGSPNLNGFDPVLLWIYLVFMNGLWVVIPVLLAWDSFTQIVHAQSLVVKYKCPHVCNAPSEKWYVAAAGIIGLYGVLVPLVLVTAKGVPVSQ